MGFFTDPVVSGSGSSTESTFVRSAFRDEIDGASDSVSVHIGSNYFIHFNGLYHIGGNQVELNVSRITFSGRKAVAVDGYGTKVGGSSAYLSEAGFSLVILYVDTIDTFQRISDIRVGKFTDLVG